MQTVETLLSGTSDKEPAYQYRRHKRHRVDSWVGRIPWRRAWQPTPVFLPGKSQGQRSLGGYRPWGCKESDMTEQLKWTELNQSIRASHVALVVKNPPLKQET